MLLNFLLLVKFVYMYLIDNIQKPIKSTKKKEEEEQEKPRKKSDKKVSKVRIK